MKSPKEIFDQVQLHIDESPGQSTRVVFDLDSTLFCVSHRSQAILNLISEDSKLRSEFREFTDALKRAHVLPTDWGIRQSIERLGLTGPRHLLEKVRDLWANNFFSNHFLHADQPYPGAVEFVQKLHAAGAHVLYLTGRDPKRMGEGTLKSLRQWKFPLANPTDLYMKPQAGADDATFKRDVLINLVADTPNVWFFENEPVIIKLVREEVPQVRIVFVDSTHSGKESSPEDLPTISMSYDLSAD